MSDLSRLTCACLAAGLSSRMRGEHKLRREIQGLPVLLQTLSQASEIGFAEKILVLGHDAELLKPLAGSFTIVKNSNFQGGLHSSIRAAVEAVSLASDALLILLADQPFGLRKNLNEFLSAVGPITKRSLARACHDSKPGHPALIGREYFSRILDEPDGDYGCSYLFKENSFMRIELPESVLWDLDTPEQFEKFSGHKI